MNERSLIVIILGFIFGSGVIKGQTAEAILDDRLTQIESTMYQDPVNAKCALLRLIRENQNVNDTTKGMIFLRLGTTLGMTNNLDSGIWAANEAIRLFPDQNIKKAGSIKLLATLYRLKGNFNSAETAIRKSISLNDSLWKDSFLKAITLQEYASLCLDRYDYMKATTLYLDALKIAAAPGFKESTMNYTATKLRVNLAEAYAASGNYDFAIREFKTAMPLLERLKDDEGYLRAGVQLADAYIHTHAFTLGDQLIYKLTLLAKKINNDELHSYLLLKQGLSYASRGEFNASLPYYQRSFEMMVKNNSPFILDCVNDYLKALIRVNDRGTATYIMSNESVKNAVTNALPADRLEYKKSAIHFLRKELTATDMDAYYQDILRLTDSVNEEKQQHSAAELQAKYQFEKQQESERVLSKENELLKQKAIYNRYQLTFFVTIASLLLVILALSLLRLRQRAKIQQNELKSQIDHAEWMEREKAFRDQLIQQQRSLLARNIADTETLKVRLDELVKEKHEDRRAAILEQLEQLKNEKMSTEIMMAQFNSVYPTFASSLLKNFPKLTQSDIQFCTLFRMNLTTKEISTLLNIEPRSIYAKKYRIMEKMGLGEGDDFEKVVFGIE